MDAEDMIIENTRKILLHFKKKTIEKQTKDGGLFFGLSIHLKN